MKLPTRQLGRFKLANTFFYSLHIDEGCNLFSRMIVIKTRDLLEIDCTEYFAAHPSFDLLKDGESIPEYIATFYSGSIYPTWTRAL